MKDGIWIKYEVDVVDVDCSIYYLVCGYNCWIVLYILKYIYMGIFVSELRSPPAPRGLSPRNSLCSKKLSRIYREYHTYHFCSLSAKGEASWLAEDKKEYLFVVLNIGIVWKWKYVSLLFLFVPSFTIHISHHNQFVFFLLSVDWLIYHWGPPRED